MTLVARAVFLALVGATFAAFFVAQELKSRPAVVDVNKLTRYFSPNGDGRRDVNEISFVVQEPDDVTAGIVNEDGDEVRRLLSAVPARAFSPVRVTWDGRDDDGVRVPDGTYRLRIGLRDQGRSVVVPRAIALDTRAPRPLVRRADEDVRVVAPGTPVAFRLRGAGRRRAAEVALWRTDVTPARRVAGLRARRGRTRVVWDGLVGGVPAPPGTYLVAATAQDRSGNVGASAPGLPGLPDEVRGSPGVTVRALAVELPRGPVRAGGRAEFLVDARGRTYRWRIRRVGARRAVARGSTDRPRLRVRAPGGVSGAYLLELRSGRFGTAVPFLVQAEERSPLLVVVPAMTWLGREGADEDGDGLPDTLARGDEVPLDRLLDGLPEDFGGDLAPLLIHLDRSRLRYDVTTDLQLARSDALRPADREGVLLAGPLRWVPPALGRSLRAYAGGGGRVASFGADTLRRSVTLTRADLRRGTAAAADDVFGARLLAPRDLRGAPLEPIDDDPRLGLFTGTAGTGLEGFSRVEESRPAEGGGARLLAALGEQVSEAEIARAEEEGTPVRDPLPALAAGRYGKGLVIRVGLPEWPGRLFEDAQVGQIHRNLLDLLRGVEPKPRSPLR